MKGRRKRRKIPSSMLQKLMRRILTVYFIILVVSLCTAAFILAPRILKEAEERAAEDLLHMRDEYTAVVNEADAYISGLTSVSEFREYMRQYRQEANAVNRARLEVYFKNFQDTNSNVFFTMLEDAYGNRISTSLYGKELYLSYIDQNPDYKVHAEQGSAYQSPVYRPAEDFVDASYNKAPVEIEGLYPFYFHSRRVNVENRAYIITVFYRMERFLNRMEALAAERFESYLVLNRSDEVIYTDLTPSETEALLCRLEAGEVSAAWREGSRLYCVSRLSALGGHVIGRSSVGKMLGGTLQVIAIILALLLLPPLVLYLTIYPISKRSLASVTALAREMEHFRIGDAPPEVQKTGDEIERITRVLHHLVNNVNRQSRALLKKEQETAETRYKLLTTQLDPHFVSNTMNIINIMARHGRNQDIVTVNNALIRILRDRLNTSQAIFGTVAEEIELVRQYMLIIEYRYAAHVNVSYGVTEEAKDKLILKNILQLLVENSLFHGLLQENDTLSGNISINIYLMDGKLILEESDDGAGIEPQRLALLREKHFLLEEKSGDAHIGLRNIYERLSLIYQDFQMELFSRPGQGTTVMVSTPVLDNENAHKTKE